MPEKFKKLCIKCSKEFESHGNRNCPACGSDEWVFIDEDLQRNFLAEEMARRRSRFKTAMQQIRACNDFTPMSDAALARLVNSI